MHWLQTFDVDLFRWLNHEFVNPVFDVLMPFVSGNAFFYPVLLVLGLLLVWKGRSRGVLCLVMLALVIAIGDGLIINTLKHAVARERPFAALPDVHCPAGDGGAAGMLSASAANSMPSAHAANWFAATMVALVYYRRSLWLMLPAALLVSFSRIYNGVHYPSDVLAGAILGAGYAGAILWAANALWGWAGRKWFPLWWNQCPSLLILPPRNPAAAEDEEELPPLESMPATRGLAPAGFHAPHVTQDEHWLRLGYLLAAVMLLARLLYLASGTIQLAEDEAYQWLWSKHLDLAYYSKPPLIAYTQFLGTSLWGDTAFGVRFFSPIIGAVLSFLLLRFFAREINARAGFFLLLILTATPLMAVGSLLMTVDPLSVLFWTAAMLAGWKAVQPAGTTRDWLWVGLWMGMGFLSKPVELFQLLCWAVFFLLWPPARQQLRRAGPYLALLVHLVCAFPVLLWNFQHHWITVTHIRENAGAHAVWRPTLKFLGDFLGLEFALLNPVFFIGMTWAVLILCRVNSRPFRLCSAGAASLTVLLYLVQRAAPGWLAPEVPPLAGMAAVISALVWASVALWRSSRQNPRLLYFFSMGAPVFLVFLLQSFRFRLLPNWIAPAIVPLACLMVVHWDAQWRLGARWLRPWLTAGLVLGLTVVLVLHNTDIISKFTGQPLAVNHDPLHRVRDWDKTALTVGQVRQDLLGEGKPVFIIAEHYGLVGQISFYLPEARAAVRETPLVYARRTLVPENQFFFWPSYLDRKGQNAIYVRELDRDDPVPGPVPPGLKAEFESVTDIGVRNVYYHGNYYLLLRPLQFFACRNLK